MIRSILERSFSTLLARAPQHVRRARAQHGHGLRASELCELTWNMIELDSGRIHVRRAF